MDGNGKISPLSPLGGPLMQATCLTTEVVNISLAYHNVKAKSNVLLPIHEKRLDIATYRYPYDYN